MNNNEPTIEPLREKIATKVAGPRVWAVLAALSALASGAGCVSTPEGEWEFAPVEAVKVAAQKVSEVPDETKADALEALAWLLGCTGAGAVAVPAVSGAAAYFRNRSRKGKAEVESAPEGDHEESEA